MTDTTSFVSGVAHRYASALFELALEANALDAVGSDLDAFDTLLTLSADLDRLVKSPVFKAEDQAKAVAAVLAKAGISGMAANFILLAARNRRLFAIRDMVRGYRQLVAAHKGEQTAEVVSAEPLSDTQVAALKEALAGVGSAKQIRVDAKVDPSILGGLVVKIGSRMIDTSLKTKLTSLKVALKEVR